MSAYRFKTNLAQNIIDKPIRKKPGPRNPITYESNRKWALQFLARPIMMILLFGFLLS